MFCFQCENSNAEVSLFYHAGHGVQSKDRNVLVPVKQKAKPG